MFSLNVPVPGAVERVAADLRPALLGFDVLPDRHTLVVKRLAPDAADAGIEKRVRRALAGAPAFEARIATVDAFADPPRGPAPVIYLAVESPGLERLHRRLCDAVDPVPAIEGDDYVPHVTLARGDAREAAEQLIGRAAGPVTWTVSELVFWDARYGEPVSRVALPA